MHIPRRDDAKLKKQKSTRDTLRDAIAVNLTTKDTLVRNSRDATLVNLTSKSALNRDTHPETRMIVNLATKDTLARN